MRKCPNCNKTYTDENFCEECGTPLVDAEGFEEQKEEHVIGSESEGASPIDVQEKKCANCGMILKKDDLFCQKYGQAAGVEVKKNEIEDNKPIQTSSQKSTEPSQKRKKYSVKSIVLTIVSIILVVFGGSFYFWGKEHYSFENQVDRFINVLSENNTSVENYLATDDPNFKITKDTIQPFFNYVNKNKQYLSNLKESLLTDGGNEEIQVRKRGSTFSFLINTSL